ncbi:hypothetical protein [Saccharothrix xinjiangensis]|uniref:Uncharacterized protein n=1 Tax=Saccharothrix xinjiangensis TaxID=204798 RepID=A0ABV9Y469_9PSEU
MDKHAEPLVAGADLDDRDPTRGSCTFPPPPRAPLLPLGHCCSEGRKGLTDKYLEFRGDLRAAVQVWSVECAPDRVGGTLSGSLVQPSCADHADVNAAEVEDVVGSGAGRTARPGRPDDAQVKIN